MHPKVARALEEIDAAVFSGDTFEDADARRTLLDYIRAWTAEIFSREGEPPCADDAPLPEPLS